MSSIDIAMLGASSLDEQTGAIKWQTGVPIGNDNDDVENLGEVDVFQSLGLASRPYPKDDSGYAEGIVVRDCGGRSAVCISARDTRTSKVVGKLEPGDTVLHSTGPQQAAQLQLKEKKRQVVAATKDSKGRAIMVVLDGKKDKLQIAGLGAIIQIDDSGDIALTNAAGSGILIQGKKIFLLGELAIPGLPKGAAVMMGPIAGSPGGPTAAPMQPVPGIGGM